MKSIKLKSIIEALKKPITSILKYTIVTTAIISSFYVGTFIENKRSIKDNKVINFIKKSEVNIAIDEGNNILIIDNKTGDYIILQDSIANSVFKLYSKNIWSQHKSGE
jgi:hypothetical protein